MERPDYLPEERRARVHYVLSMHNLEDIIIDHIECGGSVIDLAELYDIAPRYLTDFMQNHTKERKQRFMQALENRQEYSKAKILREIERLAHADIRKLYNEDGSMKPVHEWPADVAASVAGLDTEEEFTTDAETGEVMKVGQIKKIKRESKLNALKVLAVQVDDLKPRPVEVTGKISLEDLVGGSWPEDGEGEGEIEPEDQSGG